MRLLKPILGLLAATVLSAAATAQEPGPTLTLDDAIRLALQKNKLLKAASYQPKISRALLLVARGQFDPAFNFTRTYSSTQFSSQLGLPVVDSSKTDFYSASFGGTLPTGTVYSLNANTQEVRDTYSGVQRTFDTFGGFAITQPILQGFGFGYNLEPIRVAKANRAISDQLYRASAINEVTATIIAYSNLQLAHDQLDSARRAESLAASLVTENEKEFKIGFISQSDVIQARANAATYHETIIIAERAVRDAQNGLRELIGDDAFFEDEPLFALPSYELPAVTIDRHADLLTAYKMRPDYQQARLGIVIDKARESYTANTLLPTVNLNANYGYEGVGNTFYTSRQAVQNHENPALEEGITVTIPLTNAVGRGNLRAARLTREQAEETLKSTEADIAVMVAAADGQIETTRKRVAADQNAYDLAKQALDAEEKKKKEGQSSTLYVVQEQEQVAQAQNILSYALAAERQAVAQYDMTLGTTLERYHVTLADN
ncbi:MAG TPA: TolC family protein [Opitutaceae bacterium]|jgi:outer membrane protein TolC|nr:TolC family protein [Opitutaceae bacterium]